MQLDVILIEHVAYHISEHGGVVCEVLVKLPCRVDMLECWKDTSETSNLFCVTSLGDIEGRNIDALQCSLWYGDILDAFASVDVELPEFVRPIHVVHANGGYTRFKLEHGGCIERGKGLVADLLTCE